MTSLPLPLISRLLAPREGRRALDVRVGLPDALRSLPLPKDTVVVASYASTDPDHHSHAHVVLDTSLIPEAFLNEAAVCFERDGWARQEPLPHRSLFADATEPQFYPAWWRESSFVKDGWALRVEVMDSKTEDGLTDARLDYERASTTFGDVAESGGLHDLLPQLSLPEGVQLKGWGGGWYRDDANGSATFSTGRSAAEVAGYLTAQLEAAGWRIWESLRGELVALSTLEHEDKGEIYDSRVFVSITPGTFSQHAFVEATRRGKRGRTRITLFNPE